MKSTVDMKPLDIQENPKFENAGENQFDSNEEDKRKSNSLTKTSTAQTSVKGSNQSLTKNHSQRLCNSEHSSPLLERRNDEMTSLSSSALGSNYFLETNGPINSNVKMIGNGDSQNVSFNAYQQPEHDDREENIEHHHYNVKDKDTNKKPLSNSNISEFAQVSEDMNELVYHLNSIQSDISELAGKPISLCDDNA